MDDAIMAEFGRRLATKGDPISLVKQFQNEMHEVTEKILELTSGDGFEIMGELVDGIMDYRWKIERFMREEAYAHYLSTDNYHLSEFELAEKLPPDLSLSLEDGTAMFRFPVWVFGYKVPPKWKCLKRPSGRSFIRPHEFWYAMIPSMIRKYDPQHISNELRRLSKRARLNIHFFETKFLMRDLDHHDYSGMINALVSNGILASDNPEYLSLLIEFTKVDRDDQSRVEVRPEYF